MELLAEKFARMALGDKTQSPIERLPGEILVMIAGHLSKPWILADKLPTPNWHPDWWYVYKTSIQQRSLLSLAKTSRQMNAAATTLLYRFIHLSTPRSVYLFLWSIQHQPDLRRHVRQIACPQAGTNFHSYTFADNAHPLDQLLEEEVPPHVSRGGYISFKGQSVNLEYLIHIVMRLQQVRVLSICQDQLIAGPHLRWVRKQGDSQFLQMLRMDYLTTLRISLSFLPEEFLHRCRDTHLASRTLDWLHTGSSGNVNSLGFRFPALEHLEVLSPCGEWVAKLVSGAQISESGRIIEKFVQSLKTTNITATGSAEWNMLSLREPIFNPSHFYELHLDGPGWTNDIVPIYAKQKKWHLNKFLQTNGKGLRKLTLNWATRYCSNGRFYFGRARCLTKLSHLENLREFTVSLQVLFLNNATFSAKVNTLSQDMAIRQFLPRSLQILRLVEHLPGVTTKTTLVQDWHNHGDLKTYNKTLRKFLSTLVPGWTNYGEDRKVWFKRWQKMDEYAMLRCRNQKDPTVRITIGHILQVRHNGRFRDCFEEVVEYRQP